MKINNEYSYTVLEKFKERENLEESQLGKFLIGECFLVLRHPSKDMIISFVLSGINGGNTKSLWRLVYTDF
jgi:hypothetical protein